MLARQIIEDIDLYSKESLLDPYKNYKRIRDVGPFAYMNNLGMYVLARYAEMKEAIAHPEVFTSGSGVMMNATMNEALGGKIGLCTDGEEHQRIRRVESRPLTPRALRALRETITDEAEAVVERLVQRGSFDAVSDLAHYLPLSIVSNLVGLPEEGRERMLIWAAANFDSVGPLTDRSAKSLSVFEEMYSYAMNHCVRGKLKPGSWAEMLHDAADTGEITHDEARLMALSYVAPSLDTTIFAISNAIWLFAKNPEQWTDLCAHPALIPNAINEVLRLESPVQGFSRLTVTDYDFDGDIIPAQSRVIFLFGSANRDERRWPDPETFDIRRPRAGEHFAFGGGPHACVGMNLARMEVSAILTALSRKVIHFEEGSSKKTVNSTLKGFERLEITVR